MFLKIHNVHEKSSTHSTWRDICWAAFLAGGVFFVSGLVYGVMSRVALPLQDPTSAEGDLEKFHVQISQWLMVVGECLLAGVFCLALGKEIIRQLFRS